MGLLDFLHKPKGKDTKEEIEDVSKIPPIITVARQDGTETSAFHIEIAQKFRHRDGSVSCLIKAKVINIKQGDTIFFEAGAPICFEVPDGRMDLIKDVIEQNTGMQLNNSAYTYVGRAFEKGDIRLQPPSVAINNEITKLNAERLAEITNRRLENSRREEERARQEALRREADSREMDRRQEQRRRELQYRIDNPFIKGGLDGPMGEEYDGVNLTNGEILRIRNIRKIAKDTTGRYVYTARLESTPSEEDVELFDPETGVPVVFSIPFRLNDIVNSQYDESYKVQLERGLLQMLSTGYTTSLTPDETWDNSVLHDIGGIDKSGQIIQNTREAGVSIPIINRIQQLQRQYTAERKARENRQSYEDR